MVFRGVFVDGVIVPGTDLGLAEGTPIEFEIVRKPERASPLRSKGPVKRPARPRGKGKKKAAARGRPRATPRLLTPAEQRRLTAAQRVALALAGFGGWEDRPEWRGRSSADIAAELRRKAVRRSGRD